MITAKDALSHGKTNDYNRWNNSDVSAANRLAGRIVIPEPAPSFQMSETDDVFAIGSCFARNVEERLISVGINVTSQNIDVDLSGAENGRIAGIFNKYNPYSILQCLQWASGERDFSNDMFLSIGDQAYDPHIHHVGSLSSVKQLSERREQIHRYFAQAFSADVLIITLGLTECWYDMKTDVFLNTMPDPRVLRRERSRFGFENMSTADITRVLGEIFALLGRHSKPEQKVVATVSPIPLARTFTPNDILVANTTSKSRLRAGLMDVIETGEYPIDYFPSYEGVTLSDPVLTWQADRRHASELIVSNIIARFIERYSGRSLDTEDVVYDETESSSPDNDIIHSLKTELDRNKNHLIRLRSEIKKLRNQIHD